MNAPERINALASYERLAEITGRMRAAACEEDWDTVIALEGECSGLYAQLMAQDPAAPADASLQRRKSELILRLLEDDAQIRERVNAQLARIWQMIDGKPAMARLAAAYGTDAGSGPDGAAASARQRPESPAR